jgi:hypothetical protein
VLRGVATGDARVTAPESHAAVLAARIDAAAARFRSTMDPVCDARG